MIHARDDYNERIQDKKNLIPKDEPVVLLRGQDQLAIEALEYYVKLCQRHQAPDVAKRIDDHVKKMKAWPKKKIPDVPQNV